MKIKPKYSIPVIWVIILFCLLLTSSCTKKENHPNKMDTIAKALSKLKK